jgi:hypothetical protein
MPSGFSLRLVAISCVSLSAVALLLPLTYSQNPTNPWSDSQTVQPAALYKELSDAKTAPTILFVGFQRHIVASIVVSGLK